MEEAHFGFMKPLLILVWSWAVDLFDDIFSESTILSLVGTSTLETLLMVFFSTLFAILIGFPLGVLLNVTNKYGISPS